MQRSSVNKVILVGHIGNKPEGRYTPSGTSTASFSLATNETWIDSDSQKQEKTEWHNIISWSKLADFSTEYLKKGQLIYIEGRLQTRTFKDKEEIIRRITEIVATSITPLEWKTSDKNNKEKQPVNDNTEEENQQRDGDLPF